MQFLDVFADILANLEFVLVWFLCRGRRSILNVCAVFGWIEGVDGGGAFGEVEKGDLVQDNVATQGGDDGVKS